MKKKEIYVIASCVILLLALPVSGDKAPPVLAKIAQNRDFFSEPWVFHEYEDYLLYDVNQMDNGRIGIVFLSPSGWEYQGVYDTETLENVYLDVKIRKKGEREAMMRESVRIADVIKLAKSCVALSSNLHLNYRVLGKDSLPWKPIRVWDDGVKTYLQLKKGTTKAMKKNTHPTLVIYEGKEKKEVTEYRLKTDLYVVDRLFFKAELVIEGNRNRVTITRLSEK